MGFWAGSFKQPSAPLQMPVAQPLTNKNLIQMNNEAKVKNSPYSNMASDMTKDVDKMLENVTVPAAINYRTTQD